MTQTSKFLYVCREIESRQVKICSAPLKTGTITLINGSFTISLSTVTYLTLSSRGSKRNNEGFTTALG